MRDIERASELGYQKSGKGYREGNEKKTGGGRDQNASASSSLFFFSSRETCSSAEMSIVLSSMKVAEMVEICAAP